MDTRIKQNKAEIHEKHEKQLSVSIKFSHFNRQALMDEALRKRHFDGVVGTEYEYLVRELM